jgi:hypothetical protein
MNLLPRHRYKNVGGAAACWREFLYAPEAEIGPPFNISDSLAVSTKLLGFHLYRRQVDVPGSSDV